MKIGWRHGWKVFTTVLLLIVLVFSSFKTVEAAVHEAALVQDGLKVMLATSKEEYTSNEDIPVALVVENVSGKTIGDISTKIILPEGVSLKSGDLENGPFELANGEKKAFELVGIQNSTQIIPTGIESTGANTGDSSHVGMWAGIAGAALLSLLIVSGMKRKHLKKMLSIILCCALAGALAPVIQAKAETNDINITLDNTIKIDGISKNVRAIVGTNLSNSGSSTVTVSFNTDGGTPISDVVLKKGDTLTDVPEGQNDYGAFMGWYTDSARTQQFYKDTPITTNTTLYGKFAYGNELGQQVQAIQTYKADVSSDIKFTFVADSEDITVDDVKKAVTVTAYDDSDVPELSVVKSGNTFIVSPVTPYSAKTLYAISIDDNNDIYFANDDGSMNMTQRSCNFRVAGTESHEVKYQSTIQNILLTDVITKDGSTLVIQADKYAGKTFKAGDLICLWDGTYDLQTQYYKVKTATADAAKITLTVDKALIGDIYQSFSVDETKPYDLMATINQAGVESVQNNVKNAVAQSGIVNRTAAYVAAATAQSECFNAVMQTYNEDTTISASVFNRPEVTDGATIKVNMKQLYEKMAGSADISVAITAGKGTNPNFEGVADEMTVIKVVISYNATIKTKQGKDLHISVELSPQESIIVKAYGHAEASLGSLRTTSDDSYYFDEGVNVYNQTDVTLTVRFSVSDEPDGTIDVTKQIQDTLKKDTTQDNGDFWNTVASLMPDKAGTGESNALSVVDCPIAAGVINIGEVVDLGVSINFYISMDLSAGFTMNTTMLSAEQVGVTAGHNTRRSNPSQPQPVDAATSTSGSSNPATSGGGSEEKKDWNVKVYHNQLENTRYSFAAAVYGHVGADIGIKAHLTLSLTGMTDIFYVGAGITLAAYADFYGLATMAVSQTKRTGAEETNFVKTGAYYFETGIKASVFVDAEFLKLYKISCDLFTLKVPLYYNGTKYMFTGWKDAAIKNTKGYVDIGIWELPQFLGIYTSDWFDITTATMYYNTYNPNCYEWLHGTYTALGSDNLFGLGKLSKYHKTDYIDTHWKDFYTIEFSNKDFKIDDKTGRISLASDTQLYDYTTMTVRYKYSLISDPLVFKLTGKTSLPDDITSKTFTVELTLDGKTYGSFQTRGGSYINANISYTDPVDDPVKYGTTTNAVLAEKYEKKIGGNPVYETDSVSFSGLPEGIYADWSLCNTLVTHDIKVDGTYGYPTNTINWTLRDASNSGVICWKETETRVEHGITINPVTDCPLLHDVDMSDRIEWDTKPFTTSYNTTYEINGRINPDPTNAYTVTYINSQTKETFTKSYAKGEVPSLWPSEMDKMTQSNDPNLKFQAFRTSYTDVGSTIKLYGPYGKDFTGLFYNEEYGIRKVSTYMGYSNETWWMKGDNIVVVSRFNPLYNVTFVCPAGSHFADNTTSKTVSVFKDSRPEFTEVPVCDDTTQYTYTFAGWQSDLTGKTSETLPVTTADTQYTATFTNTERSYDITYDANGGLLDDYTKTRTVTLKYGATLTPPANPTKSEDGHYTYTFDRWQQVDDKGNEITSTGTTVTGAMHFKAIYTSALVKFNITFEAGEGHFADNTSTKTIQCEYGTKPTIANPEKTSTAKYDFPFLYWLYGEEQGVHAAYSVDSYKAIYGQVLRKYDVQYNTDGGLFADGSGNKTISQEYGSTTAEAGTLTKAPDTTTIYTFSYWKQVDANGNDVTDPSTTITGTSYYKAVYTTAVRKYTVTFDANGGLFNDASSKKTTAVEYNTALTVPEDPKKFADAAYTYKFSSWSPAAASGSAITADATYTAVYTATARTDDIPEVTVKAGSIASSVTVRSILNKSATVSGVTCSKLTADNTTLGVAKDTYVLEITGDNIIITGSATNMTVHVAAGKKVTIGTLGLTVNNTVDSPCFIVENGGTVYFERSAMSTETSTSNFKVTGTQSNPFTSDVMHFGSGGTITQDTSSTATSGMNLNLISENAGSCIKSSANTLSVLGVRINMTVKVAADTVTLNPALSVTGKLAVKDDSNSSVGFVITYPSRANCSVMKVAGGAEFATKGDGAMKIMMEKAFETGAYVLDITAASTDTVTINGGIATVIETNAGTSSSETVSAYVGGTDQFADAHFNITGTTPVFVQP
jgi:hypothetical protein